MARIVFLLLIDTSYVVMLMPSWISIWGCPATGLILVWRISPISGFGYGVRVELVGDLNDRFQFVGNLSLDRHNKDYTSLPVMAGLRVSTTSDEDMICFLQATGGSSYRVMGEADSESAWVWSAGAGTVFNRLGVIVEYNISRDKWSWTSIRTFLRLPLGF